MKTASSLLAAFDLPVKETGSAQPASDPAAPREKAASGDIPPNETFLALMAKAKAKAAHAPATETKPAGDGKAQTPGTAAVPILDKHAPSKAVSAATTNPAVASASTAEAWRALREAAGRLAPMLKPQPKSGEGKVVKPNNTASTPAKSTVKQNVAADSDAPVTPALPLPPASDLPPAETAVKADPTPAKSAEDTPPALAGQHTAWPETTPFSLLDRAAIASNGLPLPSMTGSNSVKPTKDDASRDLAPVSPSSAKPAGGPANSGPVQPEPSDSFQAFVPKSESLAKDATAFSMPAKAEPLPTPSAGASAAELSQAKDSAAAAKTPSDVLAQAVSTPVGSATSSTDVPVEILPLNSAAVPAKPSPDPQPAKAAKTAGAKVQPIGVAAISTRQTTPVPPDQGTGTGGAFTAPTMHSSADQNNFAGNGPAPAPVPAEASPAGSAAAAVALGKAASPKNVINNFQSGQGDVVPRTPEPVNPAASWPGNWANKLSAPNLEVSSSAISTAAVPNHAGHAEQIGQLLNQQVLTFRQSGANELAVSLKLDAHTEISLQLTSQNGQVQAAVHWERGDASSVGSHWKDLQDSLGRQNVQLLPLENKTSARTPVSQGPANNGFGQNSSSQNPRGQTRPQQEMLSETHAFAAPSKTMARAGSRQGWESYA